MEKIEKTLQIESVHPGKYGGAVFRGTIIDERTELKCVANSRTIVRIPHEGEFWHVVGLLAEHTEYGQQLYVSSANLVDLPSSSYVSSLLIKHSAFRGFYLGAEKVKTLLDYFGAKQLVNHLNEGNSHLLGAIISPAIAIKLVKAWAGLKSEIETVQFLLENNFSANLARKVIKLCLNNTVSILKTNPYALVCFENISRNIWKTIEVCARKLGIKSDDPKRLAGCVLHVLYKYLKEGHTAVPMQTLIEAAEQVLKSKSRADEGLALALKLKTICVLPCGAETLIQLTGVGWIEHSAETRIKKLIAGPSQMSMQLFGANERRLRVIIDSYSDKSIETNGYALTDEQKDAISMALSNRLSIIDGFGGTGKTFCLKTLADIASVYQRRNVYLMAVGGARKEPIPAAPVLFCR